MKHKVVYVLLATIAAGCAEKQARIDSTRFSGVAPSNEVSFKMFDQLQDELEVCLRKEGFKYVREDLRANSRIASPFENPDKIDRAEKGFGLAILMFSGPPESTQVPAPSAEYQAALLKCPAQQTSTYSEYGKIWNGLNAGMAQAFKQTESTDVFKRFSKKYQACMTSEGFPGLRDQYAAYRLVQQRQGAVTDLKAGLALELPIAVADLRCATEFGDLYKAALDEGGRNFVKENLTEIKKAQALANLVDNKKV